MKLNSIISSGGLMSLYRPVLEGKFDISHSRFQNELPELSKPSSGSECVTLPLLELKEGGLNH